MVCGLLTIAGGIGHTLPYLISNFFTATAIAAVVVVIELLAILHPVALYGHTTILCSGQSNAWRRARSRNGRSYWKQLNQLRVIATSHFKRGMSDLETREPAY